MFLFQGCSRLRIVYGLILTETNGAAPRIGVEPETRVVIILHLCPQEMEFPKTRGSILGVPIIRIMVFWGPMACRVIALLSTC